jgi:hypothetical protein
MIRVLWEQKVDVSKSTYYEAQNGKLPVPAD